MSTEKAVAVGLVVLLHLVIVWLLLRATVSQIVPPPVFRELPITLWLAPPKKPKPPAPKPEEKPRAKVPAPVRRAIGPPLPTPSIAPPPATEYNGLRALGRYLNNCSNGYYEALSQREIAHCLGNLWGPPGELPPLLGSEPSSPWKTQMEERKKPARKLEHECAQGSLNSNLGLPCYDFAH